MIVEPTVAQIVLAVLGIINTALLIYQQQKLGAVHQAVNGAKDAAVQAASMAGWQAGVQHDPPPPAALQQIAHQAPPPPPPAA